MGSLPTGGLKPWQIVLLVLLLVAGVVVLVVRGGSDDRAPAPTPVNENVQEIAP